MVYILSWDMITLFYIILLHMILHDVIKYTSFAMFKYDIMYDIYMVCLNGISFIFFIDLLVRVGRSIA